MCYEKDINNIHGIYLIDIISINTYKVLHKNQGIVLQSL